MADAFVVVGLICFIIYVWTGGVRLREKEQAEKEEGRRAEASRLAAAQENEKTTVEARWKAKEEAERRLSDERAVKGEQERERLAQQIALVRQSHPGHLLDFELECRTGWFALVETDQLPPDAIVVLSNGSRVRVYSVSRIRKCEKDDPYLAETRQRRAAELRTWRARMAEDRRREGITISINQIQGRAL